MENSPWFDCGAPSSQHFTEPYVAVDKFTSLLDSFSCKVCEWDASGSKKKNAPEVGLAVSYLVIKITTSSLPPQTSGTAASWTGSENLKVIFNQDYKS